MTVTTPTAVASAMGAAIAATMIASVESAVAMRPAVASESTIAALESTIATAEVPVITAAEPAVSATEVVAAVEVSTITVIEPSESFSATEVPMVISSEIPAAAEVAVVVAAEVPPSIVALPSIAVPPTLTPSPPVRPQVAPTVAVVVIPPTVAIVEVDPSRIVEIEICAPVERRPIESVEPRSGADEDAIVEPLRPVVAVRRARVWGIWIVAVRADWRRPDVHGRAHSNRDPNAHLRIGSTRNGSGQQHNQSNDCRIF